MQGLMSEAPELTWFRRQIPQFRLSSLSDTPISAECSFQDLPESSIRHRSTCVGMIQGEMRNMYNFWPTLRVFVFGGEYGDST